MNRIPWPAPSSCTKQDHGVGRSGGQRCLCPLSSAKGGHMFPERIRMMLVKNHYSFYRIRSLGEAFPLKWAQILSFFFAQMVTGCRPRGWQMDIFHHWNLASSKQLQSSTELWKWKKGSAPQLAKKVGDRNQDKKLARLRTFKKRIMEIAIFRSWSSKKEKTTETNVYKSL